ncbi:MAG: hypothetical protein HRT88_06250 [Lentisphaeraceae bacterium]|nr:hypothetical protein [Lentisphaeraceae bacterium]
MEIKDSLSRVNLSSSFASSRSSQAGSLAFNLSRTDRLGQRIDLLNDRKDRNARQDLLRASLSFKSSVDEMTRLFNKAKAQQSTEGAASASSSSSLGLSSTALPMDQVAELSGINSGSISVNGVPIDIDVTADSLDDVISRINSSAAGVTAAYDSGSGTFSVTDATGFTLSNGNTNFFAALNTQSGDIEGVESSQDKFLQSEKFGAAFKRFGKRLSTLFMTMEEVKDKREFLEGDTNEFRNKILESFQSGIKSTLDKDFEISGLDDALNDDDSVSTSSSISGIKRLNYGMTFFFDNPEKLLEIDEKEFMKDIRNGSDDFVKLFAFDSDVDEDDGLLQKLTATLSTLNESLIANIGSAPTLGYLVDIQA